MFAGGLLLFSFMVCRASRARRRNQANLRMDKPTSEWTKGSLPQMVTTKQSAVLLERKVSFCKMLLVWLLSEAREGYQAQFTSGAYITICA